jgi:hypothetical protein
MDSASHAPIELLRAFGASEITALPPHLTRVLQGVDVAHVKSCREKGPRCIAVVEKPRVKKVQRGWRGVPAPDFTSDVPTIPFTRNSPLIS